MKFEEVTTQKMDYWSLLLLADEQKNMVERYIEQGQMFVLCDNDVKCEAVVIKLNEYECELKNIATYPHEQGKGYGQAMIAYLLSIFLKKYQTMYVGTGDIPRTLHFYEKCGFKKSHKIKNFFADHYDHPIIEDGILLRDMIYLRADAIQSTKT